MLAVEAIETAYGASQVLFGVSFAVRGGEVATLLGRNGMGKTTTVRSIMGIVAPKAGSVSFDGKPLGGLPSFRVAQAGIGLVPEGRQIFPNLTVRENLVATAANRRGQADPWTLERVFAFFPQLAERQRNMGNQLSGGEQQMLAIGRALMTNPRLLILDEATEGLAPLIRVGDLSLDRAPQGKRPVDPHHRQGREGADAHRRCALRAREGPRRLARHVGRARGERGRPAPVSRRLGVSRMRLRSIRATSPARPTPQNKSKYSRCSHSLTSRLKRASSASLMRQK